MSKLSLQNNPLQWIAEERYLGGGLYYCPRVLHPKRLNRLCASGVTDINVIIGPLNVQVATSVMLQNTDEEEVVFEHRMSLTEVKKIRHEFVAEFFSDEGTDTPIHEILNIPEQQRVKADYQTPDLYYVHNRGTDNELTVILEVATTMADHSKAYKNVVEEKMRKYDAVLDSRATLTGRRVMFVVVVVGSNMVVSNVDLHPDMIEPLIRRMDIGGQMVRALENAGVSMKTRDTFHDTQAGDLKAMVERFGEDALGEVKHWLHSAATIEKSEKQPNEEYVNSRLFTDFMDSLPVPTLEACRGENLDALHAFKCSLLKPPSECRHKKKATVQLPLVIAPDREGVKVSSLPLWVNKDSPASVKLFDNALEKRQSAENWAEEDEAEVLRKALEVVDPSYQADAQAKSLRNKWHRVKVNDLNPETIAELNMDGLWAKREKGTSEYQARRLETQKVYSIDMDVSHINKFLEAPNEYKRTDSKALAAAFDALMLANKISGNDPAYLQEMKRLCDTKLFHGLLQMALIGAELAMSINQNVKDRDFVLKKVRDLGIELLIHPTGSDSHLFYVIKYDKGTEVLDESGTFRGLHELRPGGYVTDLLSINKNRLKNVIEAPFIYLNMMIHWTMRLTEVNPQELSNGSESNPVVLQMVKLCLLLSLEDKPTTEIITTETRYLYMELAKGVDVNSPPQIKGKLKKFPSRLRTCLQVWLINKIIDGVAEMCVNPPLLNSHFLSPEDDDDGDLSDLSSDSWIGFVNPYTGTPIEEAAIMVDLMYLSYGMNKDRAAEGEKGMEMITKIIEECANEDPASEAIYSGQQDPPVDREPKSHEWSYSYVAEGTDLIADQLRAKLGEHWQTALEDSFYHLLAYNSTSVKLATLKASALIDKTDTMAKEEISIKDRKSLSARLRDMDRKTLGEFGCVQETKERREVEEELKRKKGSCKCVEAIVREFDFIGLLPPLQLEQIVMRIKSDYGGACCYLFPKAQHGGPREIYVLDILSRIVQIFIENAARVVCKHFSHETLNNPQSKIRSLDEHEIAVSERARATDSISITRRSSEDKTRWNQQIDVRSFHFIISRLMPPKLSKVLGSCLSLWKEKKVLIPQGIQNMLLKGTKLTDDVYSLLMRAFHHKINPEDPPGTKFLFEEGPQRRFMKVRMGMWQGILHNMSSLLHLVQAEHFKYLFRTLTPQCLPMIPSLELECTALVSSDDSILVMTILVPEGSKKEDLRRADHLLGVWSRFSSKHCKYFNMKDSAKSCIGSSTISEYNSTFMLKGGIINPILKFVYSSLSITHTESLKKKSELSHNLIKDLAENGASSIQCHYHQLVQGLYHYLSMGLGTSGLFERWMGMLHICPDPNLGFFLLSPDKACGILPFAYDYWRLLTGRQLPIVLSTPLVVKSNVTGLFTNQVLMRIGDRKRWERLALGTEQPGWREYIDEHPEVLFKTTPETEDEFRAVISMLVTSPGVYEGLRGGSHAVAMFQSSVYTLQTPCVTIGEMGFQSEHIHEPEPGLEQEGRKVYISDKKKASLFYVTKKHVEEVLNKKVLDNTSEEDRTPEEREHARELKIITEDLLTVMFPSHELFKSIMVVLETLTTTHGMTMCSRFRQRKNKISFTSTVTETLASPLPAFKCLWFNDESMSRTAMNLTVSKYRAVYGFLKDTLEETVKASNFSSAIEVVNFLMSLAPKTRSCVPVCKRIKSSEPMLKVKEYATWNPWPGFRLNENAGTGMHHQYPGDLNSDDSSSGPSDDSDDQDDVAPGGSPKDDDWPDSDDSMGEGDDRPLDLNDPKAVIRNVRATQDILMKVIYGVEEISSLKKLSNECVRPRKMRLSDMSAVLDGYRVFSSVKARTDQILTLPTSAAHRLTLLHYYLKSTNAMSRVSTSVISSLHPAQRKCATILKFFTGDLNATDLPVLLMSQMGGQFYYYLMRQKQDKDTGAWFGPGSVRLLTSDGCVTLLIHNRALEAIIAPDRQTVQKMIFAINETVKELGVTEYRWSGVMEEYAKAMSVSGGHDTEGFDGISIRAITRVRAIGPTTTTHTKKVMKRELREETKRLRKQGQLLKSDPLSAATSDRTVLRRNETRLYYESMEMQRTNRISAGSAMQQVRPLVELKGNVLSLIYSDAPDQASRMVEEREKESRAAARQKWLASQGEKAPDDSVQGPERTLLGPKGRRKEPSAGTASHLTISEKACEGSDLPREFIGKSEKMVRIKIVDYRANPTYNITREEPLEIESSSLPSFHVAHDSTFNTAWTRWVNNERMPHGYALKLLVNIRSVLEFSVTLTDEQREAYDRYKLWCHDTLTARLRQLGYSKTLHNQCVRKADSQAKKKKANGKDDKNQVSTADLMKLALSVRKEATDKFLGAVRDTIEELSGDECEEEVMGMQIGEEEIEVSNQETRLRDGISQALATLKADLESSAQRGVLEDEAAPLAVTLSNAIGVAHALQEKNLYRSIREQDAGRRPQFEMTNLIDEEMKRSIKSGQISLPIETEVPASLFHNTEFWDDYISFLKDSQILEILYRGEGTTQQELALNLTSWILDLYAPEDSEQEDSVMKALADDSPVVSDDETGEDTKASRNPAQIDPECLSQELETLSITISPTTAGGTASSRVVSQTQEACDDPVKKMDERRRSVRFSFPAVDEEAGSVTEVGESTVVPVDAAKPKVHPSVVRRGRPALIGARPVDSRTPLHLEAQSATMNLDQPLSMSYLSRRLDWFNLLPKFSLDKRHQVNSQKLYTKDQQKFMSLCIGEQVYDAQVFDIPLPPVNSSRTLNPEDTWQFQGQSYYGGTSSRSDLPLPPHAIKGTFVQECASSVSSTEAFQSTDLPRKKAPLSANKFYKAALTFAAVMKSGHLGPDVDFANGQYGVKMTPPPKPKHYLQKPPKVSIQVAGSTSDWAEMTESYARSQPVEITTMGGAQLNIAEFGKKFLESSRRLGLKEGMPAESDGSSYKSATSQPGQAHARKRSLPSDIQSQASPRPDLEKDCSAQSEGKPRRVRKRRKKATGCQRIGWTQGNVSDTDEEDVIAQVRKRDREKFGHTSQMMDPPYIRPDHDDSTTD